MAPPALPACAAEMRGRVLPQRFWPSPFMPTKVLKPGAYMPEGSGWEMSDAPVPLHAHRSGSGRARSVPAVGAFRPSSCQNRPSCFATVFVCFFILRALKSPRGSRGEVGRLSVCPYRVRFTAEERNTASEARVIPT